MTSEEEANNRKGRERRKFVVIPYIHGLSRNLKRIAGRCDVDVLFSAPDKLSRLCRAVNPSPRAATACSTRHRDRFVSCSEGVVYSLPLTCGKRYVGQTGRCLNDRLREHAYSVSTTVSGHLGIHCRDCGCLPDFQRCEIVKRHRDQLTREILEAVEIARLGAACVSSPSVALSGRDEFSGFSDLLVFSTYSVRLCHGAFFYFVFFIIIFYCFIFIGDVSHGLNSFFFFCS